MRTAQGRQGDERARTGAWVVALTLLLMASVAASVAAARAWTDVVRAEQQRSAAAEAAGVASAVSMSLQRMSDLTRALGAAWTSQVDMTDPELVVWADSLDIEARYPETLALTVIVPVSQRELPGLVEALRREGAPAAEVAALAALPPRDGYCLPLLGAAFVDPAALPQPGPDLCADPGTVGFLHVTRDSGEPLVLPLADAATGTSRFFSLLPLYRPGAPVTTAPQRRAALLGWAANLYDADAVLSHARDGRDTTGLLLRRTDIPSSTPGGEVVASVGPVERGQTRLQRVTLTADGSWGLDVVTPRPPGLTAREQGLAVLVGGLALTLLTLGLVTVLGGSRERALRLVRATTRELQHQATHDALTGLPNRTLLLDLLEQRLAAAARGGPAPAVLFLDLDDFKQVNDSLGHAAGDALLREVAARLRASVRADDVVGRFAGDEFLMLVDDARGATAAAERVLAALRDPVRLPGEPGGRRVTASIGVGTGAGTGEQLLHAADLGLYQAKAAGRDGWARHGPVRPAEPLLPRPREGEQSRL